MQKSPPYTVAALYHFAKFDRYEAFKPELEALCHDAGLKGTLLLASEGINGTVAGSREGIDRLIAFLHAQPEFTALEHKESHAEDEPFLRMKVRLKKEIVTMGVPGTDPLQIVGTYVEPHDWNALISDPGHHRHRHPQRLRIRHRHLRRAPSTRTPRPSANSPTGCAATTIG